MQDKKSFGSYIVEKRKQTKMTQEELANKLNVIPTTISKWERGVTYPDITIIPSLCKELNITEHEFFMACDDEVFNKEKREIEKYKKAKRLILPILNMCYLIGILTCLICDTVINKKLTWSLIALLGICISFTLTSLPLYFKKNKYRYIKTNIIFMFEIYLLLFTINYVYGGSWLIPSFIIATFILTSLWIIILICSLTNMKKHYKISVSLIILSIIIIFTNPLSNEVLNITSDNNIFNVISGIIMLIISIILLLKNKNQ